MTIVRIGFVLLIEIVESLSGLFSTTGSQCQSAVMAWTSVLTAFAMSKGEGVL